VAVHVRTHTSSAATIYTQNHKDNVHRTSSPLEPCNTSDAIYSSVVKWSQCTVTHSLQKAKFWR